MCLRNCIIWFFLCLACSLSGQNSAEVGSISGRLIDESTGSNLPGVTVAIRPMEEPAGAALFGTTDNAGRFSIPDVPTGSYAVRLFKGGYQLVELEDIKVSSGSDTKVNYPLQSRQVSMPSAAEDDGVAGGDVFELAAFQVTAEELSRKEQVFFDLRTNIDNSVDFLSVDDLSKFAASDMADAIKRIPGVNVQEGKFAVIRGLDERYTSTLLNNMAIPSPDPDRQSPQLDLFPSEVVGSLAVVKSFSPELPGNSAGGSINIVTSYAPEELEVKLSAGTGFNDNARDVFYDARKGTSTGALSDDDQWEYEFGVSIGIPLSFKGREARLNMNVSKELDFETKSGILHERSPLPSVIRGILRDEEGNAFFDEFNRPIFEATLGDMAKGTLSLSDGIWDADISSRYDRFTAFVTAGMDFDKDGKHSIDVAWFTTSNDEETVDFRSNARFPGLEDFEGTVDEFVSAVTSLSNPSTFLANAIKDDSEANRANQFSEFYKSSTFFREREFSVVQLFGEHEWDIDSNNLLVTWGGDYATTSQMEESSRFTYWFQPEGTNEADPNKDDIFRTSGGQSGGNPLFFSANDVDEEQVFGRIDVEYGDRDAGEENHTIKFGLFYEDASRDVTSTYANRLIGSADFAAGNSVGTTGTGIEEEFLELGGGYSFQPATNDSSRKIVAAYLGAKFAVTDSFDLLVGVRHESIRIQSINDPFTGELDFTGIPGIFPTKFMMFEVIDDPIYDGFGSALETYETSNARLLGIPVPIGENGIVNLTEEDLRNLLIGDIDRNRFLPSLGAVWRPRTGLRVLFNFSETVARPSFREISYYLSAAPDSDDLVIGNPQLGLSTARSFDFRMEYVSSETGNLYAFSAFKKDIENPIEKITLTDPLTRVSAQTFFNNENSADLKGIELEARRNLGSFGPEFLDYFTIGGNLTYIDASVGRPRAEIDRFQQAFIITETGSGNLARPGLDTDPRFDSLPTERKLFNQPEWIANADLTFEREDWGTTITLSVFAISEVLGSSGSITIDPATNSPREIIPDRYIGSYIQWDLVLQQEWKNWSFKLSLKNLTDSTRTSHYDSGLFDPEIEFKEFKVGRDLSISASYSF